jgi:hypothetical protein
LKLVKFSQSCYLIQFERKTTERILLEKKKNVKNVSHLKYYDVGIFSIEIFLHISFDRTYLDLGRYLI